MKPKPALFIVILIVLLGEAIAQLLAEHASTVIAIGIGAFAAFFIYAVKSKNKA